jgi:hypothetical protein
VYTQWPLYGLFHLVLQLAPATTNHKPYYLSVCTIFKDEAPYLREWLTYHVLVGVQHFYLYNNNSTDDYAAALAPFINAGQVTLIDWPMHPGQVEAYQHCLDTYHDQSHWIATVDCDEFWVPTEAWAIPHILQRFERYPMLAFYWNLFGSSGQLAPQLDKLVTEQYTVCDPQNQLFKTVYNTRYPNKIKNSHYGVCRWRGLRFKPMLPDGSFVPHCPSTKRRHAYKKDAIQINHYWSKSFADYGIKRNKGLPSRLAFRDINQFYWHDMTCTTADHTIYRFLTRLKIELARRSTEPLTPEEDQALQLACEPATTP